MKSKKIILRQVTSRISDRLFQGKAIILLGPRQSGKTTLIQDVLERSGEKYLMLNADEPDVRELLEEASSARLRTIIGNSRLVCIDEAQRIPNIGLTLKLLTDQIPEVQAIATGSSSLELHSSIAEPLTGRKFEFTLPPLAFEELSNHHGLLQERRFLEHRLVYGSYPEVVISSGQEEELVRLLADSYLFKDLLTLEGIKKPSLLERIVKALALQLGSEVSLPEIARTAGADTHTVERYIDLLEKAFVLFRVPAYSRNVRNEIKKGRKIYFLDNGVRNAVIGNFLPLSSRTDTGALWENYLVAERRKMLANKGVNATAYFWRTTQQQEIDYIEERERSLLACEFKWNPNKKRSRFPTTFLRAYPQAQTRSITPSDYDLFLTQADF
ncbi:MAG: ATP-binding protein [Desulfohalobiaceae bacterium]